MRAVLQMALGFGVALMALSTTAQAKSACRVTYLGCSCDASTGWPGYWERPAARPLKLQNYAQSSMNSFSPPAAVHPQPKAETVYRRPAQTYKYDHGGNDTNHSPAAAEPAEPASSSSTSGNGNAGAFW